MNRLAPPARGVRPLAAVVLSLAVCGCTGGTNPPPPPGPSSPSTTAAMPTPSTAVLSLPTASAAPLPAGRTQEIETALASGNEAAVRGAIAVPTGATLSPDAIAALKDLKGLRLDPATFHPISSTAALIDGSTADGHQWTVYLTLDGGVWKIAATEAK